MIEDIRKQHEELRDLIKPDQRDYIQPCISIADVDRLFAALDSLREEASLYQKEWAKLRAALDAERGRIYPCADCGNLWMTVTLSRHFLSIS